MSKFLTPLKFIIPALAILFLNVQPNWLPLQNDFAVMREAQKAGKFTAEARDAIYDLAARQPWNGERAESAGLAALAAKDYEKAKVSLQTAAAIKGWSQSLHVAMGDTYLGLNDRKKAISEWEIALKAKIDDVSVLGKLGVAYEAEGRYADAALMYRTLTTLQPRNAQARYRYGVLLSVVEPTQAGSHLAIAAEVDPKVKPFADSLNKAINAGLDAKDPAYLAGAVGYTLIGLKEFKLARTSLAKAVELKPTFAEAYAYLGLAEDRLGNDGTYAYEQALKLDPKSSFIHYLYGQHFRRNKSNDRALAELQESFRLDPSNAGAAAELGSAYVNKNDLLNAETWYAQAVRIAPSEGEFSILLAQFYLDNDLKVAEGGLPAAKRAAELSPDSAAAHDVLGHALYLTNNFKDAEASLLTAAALDPTNPRAYFHLGLLYTDLKRTSEAKAALNLAATYDAGGPIAELALRALARLGR